MFKHLCLVSFHLKVHHFELGFIHLNLALIPIFLLKVVQHDVHALQLSCQGRELFDRKRLSSQVAKNAGIFHLVVPV
jgi:hypothetical protein